MPRRDSAGETLALGLPGQRRPKTPFHASRYRVTLSHRNFTRPVLRAQGSHVACHLAFPKSSCCVRDPQPPPRGSGGRTHIAGSTSVKPANCVETRANLQFSHSEPQAVQDPPGPTPTAIMSSRSESEGEVLEREVDKATPAQPPSKGISVDRQCRPRASDTISQRDAPEDRPRRYHSRSPHRNSPPRGEKRRRDDDLYNDRDRHDRRRFKVRYEDKRPYDDDRRHRVSYADIDRGDSSRHASRYDDPRDRNHYNRHSTRSRSPPRGHARGNADRGYDRRNGRHEPERRERRQQGRENGAEWRSREHSGTERVNTGKERHPSARHDPPTRSTQPDAAMKDADAEAKPYVSFRGVRSTSLTVRSPAGTLNGAPKDVEAAGAHDQAAHDSEPLDEAALIEERRKRREAIKAKYKGQSTPLIVQVLQPGVESGPSTPQAESPVSRTERSGMYHPTDLFGHG